MSKETFGIGILSLTAAVLLIANYFVSPQPVMAGQTFADRDFQVVTAKVQTGSEAVFVLDKRNGIVVVLTYDPANRQMSPRTSRPLSDAFMAR